MNRRAFLTTLTGAAVAAAMPAAPIPDAPAILHTHEFIVPPCAHHRLLALAEVVDVSTHDRSEDRFWKKRIVVDVNVHCQDCGADDLKIA